MTRAEKQLIDWMQHYSMMPLLMTKAQLPDGVVIEDGEDIDVPIMRPTKDQAHGLE